MVVYFVYFFLLRFIVLVFLFTPITESDEFYYKYDKICAILK